jgi:sortase B
MRKKAIIILTVILFILIGVVAYMLISTWREDELAKKEYNLYGSELYRKSVSDEDIQNVGVSTDDNVSTETAEESVRDIYAEQIKIQQGINWSAFESKNKDFLGIISIPELGMWYPFVQNSESDYNYYLEHTYSGEKNANGAIFLDYLFDGTFSDNHSIMFGHNMKNYTMFGSLKTLIESQYTKDIIVYIYQKDQILIYKAYSAYLSEPESMDYYAQLTDEYYDAYYTNAIQSAMYLNNDEQVKNAYKNGNALLTLSTCHANDHSDFTVVQNILIERILIDNEE